MATKKRYFVNGNYYHVFNRGVEKRKVFLKDNDYKRFSETMEHCLKNAGQITRKSLRKNTQLALAPVDVVAYCLMSNHFHLLVKQNSENGISTFFSRLSNSYTKYFNTKYDRVGPLFQGPFKTVNIETDSQLLHLSRYIHLNPVVSGITDDPRAFQWSSYKDYISDNETFIKPEIVLGNFISREDYQQFVLDQIDYARTLEELKHLSLD